MVSAEGCPLLVRGLNGGYRFTKQKTGAMRTVPDKNDREGFSHVQDDLQYVALVVNGGLMPRIAERLRAKGGRRRGPRPTAAGWT